MLILNIKQMKIIFNIITELPDLLINGTSLIF